MVKKTDTDDKDKTKINHSQTKTTSINLSSFESEVIDEKKRKVSKPKKEIKIKFRSFLASLVAAGILGSLAEPLFDRLLDFIFSPKDINKYIKVESLNMNDTFYSSLYNYYNLNSKAKLKLEVMTDKKIEGTFSLAIKDYMESRDIFQIIEGKPEQFKLGFNFSSNILTIKDTTKRLAELTLNYTCENHDARPKSKHTNIKILGRNFMNPNDPRSLVVFINPYNETIQSLASTITKRINKIYKDSDVTDQILKSILLFYALNTIGISHRGDLKDPYNYVRYPQETLNQAFGSSKDLLVLYSSLLESVGVSVALVPVSDYFIILVNTNLRIEESHKITPNKNFFCVNRNDYIWLPLDLKELSTTFFNAWRAGCSIYNELKSPELIDIKKFHETYKPLNVDDLLPSYEIPSTLAINEMHEKLKNELKKIEESRLHTLIEVEELRKLKYRITELEGEKGNYNQQISSIEKDKNELFDFQQAIFDRLFLSFKITTIQEIDLYSKYYPELEEFLTIDTAISGLDNSNSEVRRVAAYSLGLIGDEYVVKELVKRLNIEKDLGVKFAITKAIGTIGGQYAFNVLKQISSDAQLHDVAEECIKIMKK